MRLDEINLARVQDFVGHTKADGYSHDVEFMLRGRLHRRKLEGQYSAPTINKTLSTLR